MALNTRPDHSGTHRAAYTANRKTILASQDVCAICGQLVDKKLKPPHPMAPVVDHIIPVAKGGHPSAMSNLQLAHASCNRQKSDKIYKNQPAPKNISNRNLPQSADWSKWKASDK